jgi:hypothetical protein
VPGNIAGKSFFENSFVIVTVKTNGVLAFCTTSKGSAVPGNIAGKSFFENSFVIVTVKTNGVLAFLHYFQRLCRAWKYCWEIIFFTKFFQYLSHSSECIEVIQHAILLERFRFLEDRKLT